MSIPIWANACRRAKAPQPRWQGDCVLLYTSERCGKNMLPHVVFRRWWPLNRLAEIPSEQLGGVARDIWAKRIVGQALADIQRHQARVTQLDHMVLGGGFGELQTFCQLGKVHFALG